MCTGSEIWSRVVSWAKCERQSISTMSTRSGYIYIQDTQCRTWPKRQSGYQRYQSGETRRCEWRPRRRAFSLEPDWLRNKLWQIKHVIRLWSPMCCPALFSPLLYSALRWAAYTRAVSLDPVQQRQRERKEGRKRGSPSTPQLLSHCIVRK